MYNFISGTVADISFNTVVIECGGIGYEIFATSGCTGLCTVGKTVKVYVHLAVKEDDMSLYGFVDQRERTMFYSLVSVSGVGNKTAISILSGIGLQELAVSIATQNVSVLSKIKGIGKKTAERILFDLKDKVSKEVDLELVVDKSSTPIKNSQAKDAQAALISLGFKQSEVQSMLNNIEITSTMSAEDIIGMALRKRN